VTVGLPTAIRDGLRAAAEPERAPGMQAYMRSTMPYLGVRVPVVRRIVRAAVKADPPAGVHDLLPIAATLWRQAVYREERYAATELLGLRPARGRLEALPLLTEVIVVGAWWDHVDAVAHCVGAVLRAHRAAVEPVVRAWSVDADRWLRRASIICQLDARDGTDLDLLTDVIDANLADREFFVRKAIGWALRQYARTDPDWVLAFVTQRRAALSPLSYREAVKHLG
jgi:3-methyladenine DNA glycosylase AlkD